VTARFREGVAKVRPQLRYLAAIVSYKIDHLAEPRKFAFLSLQRTAVQVGRERLQIVRHSQAPVTLSHALDLQLDQLLFAQVIHGPYNSVPRGTGGMGRLLQVDVKPRPCFLSLGEHLGQELPPLAFKAGQNLSR
jgi:hypothetical protein